MSAFQVVIPARMGSVRLPGKPLLDIGGLPMVVRVARQAAEAGARSVIVATDDPRIFRAVAQAGHRAAMTRAGHPSGSDRVREVVDAEGWGDRSIVLNIQGDEPLMPPPAVRQLAAALAADPKADAATLCAPIEDSADLADPNLVKLVRDRRGRALYFSRAAIPAPPDGEFRPSSGLWRRHIGIYGYRAAALRRFAACEPSPLERAERLEQLRLLENGMAILALDACCPVPGGVDTREDLQRVRAAVVAGAEPSAGAAPAVAH